MQDWAIWSVAVLAVSLLLSGAVTVHAVLHKRDSRAVIGWVALAWLAPILGFLVYLILGINRIHRKASSLKLRQAMRAPAALEPTSDEWQQAEDFIRHHPNLVGLEKAGQALSGLLLMPGNSVAPLINGDEAYPAMIDAIGSATRSVTLLSYIFDSDRAGDAFLEALVDAQRRDVEVRVLIDGVGSTYSRPNMVGRLKKAGIATASFLPTRIPRLPTYANMRNHRKILVVDGRIGFTGGTNIREGHVLGLQPEHPVQCVHFRLTGPVVADMQLVFAIDWAFTTGEKLTGESWFPAVERCGSVWARGIEHGPDEQFERLTDLMAAALASARQRVRIVTPYFLPHASLIQALNVTAMRGVDVEIYIPSHSNIALVQWATQAQLSQNLDKGCRVFYTAPPFDHTKVMIVDDAWSLIGSTNWDPRSLRLNFEFNVECYDCQLARQLNEIIDQKATSAREVSREELDQRGYPVRIRDGLSRVLSPYL